MSFKKKLPTILTASDIQAQRTRVEGALLGFVLNNHEEFRNITLSEKDFYDHKSKMLFKILSDLSQQGSKWDLVIVCNEAERRGISNTLSSTWISHLADLGTELGWGKVGFEEYVKELRSMQKSMVVYESLQEVGTEDPLKLADQIQERYQNLDVDSRAKKVSDLMLALYEECEEAYEQWQNNGGNPVMTGVPSGIGEVDKMFWGFQPGKLYILAARPSMGKSALSMNIAVNAAEKGYGVYIQSLEETGQGICTRILSRKTKILNSKLQKKLINNHEHWAAMLNALNESEKLNLLIDDSSGLSSSEIFNRVSREAARSKIDLVLVDHLQEIKESSTLDRRIQVGLAVSTLKSLAKRMDIPVILLCQLSRQTEYVKNNIPSLGHLKESGDIEAVADAVILLYRESYYDDEVKAAAKRRGWDEMTLICAKNRDGQTGKVTVKWIPDTMTIASVTEYLPERTTFHSKTSFKEKYAKVLEAKNNRLKQR